MKHVAVWTLSVALLAALGLAQQGATKDSAKQDKSKDAKSKQKDDDSPFHSPLKSHASKSKGKESDTLAFNGVDPTGKVSAQAMAATPAATDKDKVAAMAKSQPSDADLKAFIKEGGLNGL